MKLNLDRLLNNDDLTIDQKLFIRSLIDYEIVRCEKDIHVLPYKLNYTIKDVPVPISPLYMEFKDLDTLKSRGYQLVMSKIIRHYAFVTSDQNTIDKVKRIMKEGTARHNLSYGKEILFANYDTMAAPDYRFVKNQSLFLCLRLLREGKK